MFPLASALCKPKSCAANATLSVCIYIYVYIYIHVPSWNRDHDCLIVQLTQVRSSGAVPSADEFPRLQVACWPQGQVALVTCSCLGHLCLAQQARFGL